MRFKLTLFLFSSILFLNNCEKIESDIPQNEYAIYNALFIKITESEEVEIDSINIAIVDSTSLRNDLILNNEYISELEEEWDTELTKDLINDFRIKNTSRYFIQDYFKTDLKYQLIVTNEIDKIFDNSFSWLVIEERFPNVRSILRFSRVGLNTQKNKALLFMSISCGALCGTSTLLYFEKIDNKWELTNEKMFSVS
jgi:hypothetical protein|tara:strand:- start:40390 stop:40980 length:591 start_codon:yes stop_codon:yes gene_type:complete